LYKLSNYSWLDFTGFLPSLIPGSPHILYTAGLVLVGHDGFWAGLGLSIKNLFVHIGLHSQIEN